MSKRRLAALWLLLFAVYASTLGMRAFDRSEYGGDEPHYLLTAKALVEQQSPDLRDEYAERGYRDFFPYELTPQGSLTNGRANEPHGIGFPLLIAPAYAIAGANGVKIFLAMLSALALVLAYVLARRVVPDPWALGATLAVGLSPPMLAFSTAVYPEMAASAGLCGALLLALRIPESPRRRTGWSAAALVAALPWLGTKYLLPGLVIAIYAYRALRAERRPMLGLTSIEIVGFSVALYVGVNEGLYGGLTPYSAGPPGGSATAASTPLDYAGRVYRLVALLIDREYGILRWAPILALALYGVWFVWRESRSGLVRAIPALRAEQRTGQLCALVAGTQLFSAAFLAPGVFGFWFPGRHLIAALPLCVPLVALGVRRLPRTGVVLGAIGIAASVWIYIAIRFGHYGWIRPLPNAPLGPLNVLVPSFRSADAYPVLVGVALALALIALVASSELRRARRVPAA